MNKEVKGIKVCGIGKSPCKFFPLVFCLSIISCIAVSNTASVEAAQAEQEGCAYSLVCTGVSESLPPNTFDTFIDLLAENDFTNGMVIQTRGYYQLYDGGSAAYRITSIRPDTYCEELNGGLFAALMSNGFVNPRMFGAFGDGVHDDTQAVQNAIDFAYETNSSIVFPTGTVYAVTTITLLHGNQSIDFCGCTLKALDVGPILDAAPPVYDTTAPNGYLKNLTIDMNNTAATGLHVDRCWRKIFEDIIINYPPPNGTGLHLEGGNSAAGNLFHNIRGKSKDAPGAVFIVIDAGDNTFSNIDFVGYQYGININYFTVMSDVHGYIINPEIFPGSYFIKLHSHAQLTNIYPDTQQYALIANGNNASVIISNLILVFNTKYITKDILEQYPAYVVQTAHYFKTRNMVINGLQMNTDIYDNEHFCTLKTAPIQVNGYAANTNLSNLKLSRPGVAAVDKNTACSYLSAGFGEDPILYTEGYHDVITADSFVDANQILCKWLVSQRFTPQSGAYPAVLHCSDTDEDSLVILNVRCGGGSSDERIVSVDYPLSAGDKLYIDLPVYDHPCDLFNETDS